MPVMVSFLGLQLDPLHNCTSGYFNKSVSHTVQPFSDATAVVICNVYITALHLAWMQRPHVKTRILLLEEPLGPRTWFKDAYRLYKSGFFHIVYGCIHDSPRTVYRPFYLKHFTFQRADSATGTNTFEAVNLRTKNTTLKELVCKKFAALINRHDPGRTREPIWKVVSAFGQVACPGKLFNNCSNTELNAMGKPKWLAQFLFNICPENFPAALPGYISEKIFDALLSGAIPIYFGQLTALEKRLFNVQRILQVDPYDPVSLQKLKLQLQAWRRDTSSVLAFYQQPVFLEGAYEIAQEHMRQAVARFKELLNVQSAQSSSTEPAQSSSTEPAV